MFIVVHVRVCEINDGVSVINNNSIIELYICSLVRSKIMQIVNEHH